MLKTILFIGIGGGLGSIFRYLISIATHKYLDSSFPWATFTANVVGCLIIGILFGLIERQQLTNPNLSFFLITGFCGGFTTFSAFSLESMSLFQSGNHIMAFFYIAISVILGLAAIGLGVMMAKIL